MQNLKKIFLIDSMMQYAVMDILEKVKYAIEISSPASYYFWMSPLECLQYKWLPFSPGECSLSSFL